MHYLIFLFLSLIVVSAERAFAGENSGEKKKTSTTIVDAKGKTDDKEKEDANKDEASNTVDKDEDEKHGEPPPIGNFSLPGSQQPYGLFAFGGNILDKSEVQLYFFADYLRGKRRVVADQIPSILFGITGDWSIWFNFPIVEMKDGRNKSRGLGDFFIQLEYAFYNKKTLDYVDQATVVANVTTPTGSVKKDPPTGFGSPSLFLGGTYTRTMVDWFLFTTQGAILTTADHKTKIGEQFLYQFGFGRNFRSPPGWIYAWMVEIDGQYSKKNRIRGRNDPNSGGNVVYVTPSIWISSKDMLIQFGPSFPINQNLFGRQNKIDYAFNFNFAWSFY